MIAEVRSLLDRVRDTADFAYVEFVDINDTNALGDNALHCVIVWGEYESAQLLIDNGININQPGEHLYTPLHTACARSTRQSPTHVELLRAQTSSLEKQMNGIREK